MVRSDHPLLSAATILLVILGLVVPGFAATHEEIDAAIARGQTFLFSKMKTGGRWEPDAKRIGDDNESFSSMQGGTWGGYTAIATYALLASGIRPQDERLEATIEFLKNADIVGPYSCALRAQVWTFFPKSAEMQRLLRRDLELLMRTSYRRGPLAGLWTYQPPDENTQRYDHSVSQYGVLGLWACAQGGVPIDVDLWKQCDSIWRAQQHPNGGWSYGGSGSDANSITHSMTAAGIATLFITQEMIPNNAGLNCIDIPVDEHIERGLRWFSVNFKDAPNNNYLWYGIERIGAASGRKYFGDQDWYETGAERVVRSQKKDGSWDTGFPGATPVPDTAFALLFLSRGRAPVVMNKLDYTAIGSTVEAGGIWNRRARDAANLSRWIGREAERYVGWQVVTLQRGHRELLDAPILYIAGSENLVFKDEEIATLRKYVEDGGLILGNADCGKEEFVRAFRKLGSKMFPEYSFRLLPASHSILTNQQFRADKWKQRIDIEGLSNGARELMLLIPSADPARAWQIRVDRGKEEFFQLGANIYLYVTDKRIPRTRAETYLVEDDGALSHSEIPVARLIVNSDSDPEPGGWRRLGTVVHNEHGVGVNAQPVKLGDGKLVGGPGRIAHLTGTRPFELSPAQQAEIKKFVTDGGTLLIDAAGGSSAFADAAQHQLASIFGGEDVAKQLSTPLPRNHALFSNPASPISKFTYRPYAMQHLTGSLQAPRIRGITIYGRLAVIFSREDLSVGFVGQNVDGILGYDPATATAIGRNVILLVAGIDKAPSSRPMKQKPLLKKPTTGDGLD